MPDICSLFAGIGGIDLGFMQAGFNVVWANEMDTAACKTYRHNFSNDNLVEDNIINIPADTIPDFDVLTAGFPCQPFSIAGLQKGFKDRDGNLFFEITRIIDAKRPKVVFLENVPTLLSERHKGNFMTWIKDLEELGYKSKPFLLNASDFGLPQNRPRLLMISVYVGKNSKKTALFDKYFSTKEPNNVVDEYKQSKHYRKIESKELFRINYADAKLRAEAIECTPNDTVSRREIWEENPKLVLKGNKINEAYPVIRTITTKQDRNPNSGNLYFDSGIAGRGKFRYLTPRECLLFMGFTDNDYENIIKKNPEVHKNSVLFPRDKIIRMAGNSIPVKLLEGIFYQIIKFDEQMENN